MKAVQIFESLCPYYPNKSICYYNIATCYMAAGNHDKSIEFLEKACALGARDRRLHDLLRLARESKLLQLIKLTADAFERGDIALADNHFQKSMSLNLDLTQTFGVPAKSEEPDAFLSSLCQMRSAGKVSATEYLCRKFLEQKDNEVVRSFLVSILLESGKKQEALKEREKLPQSPSLPLGDFLRPNGKPILLPGA